MKPAHWSSATSIRGIFKEAFTNAGLPYFHPHSLRNTLVRYGQSKCQTPEQFKAWSQNLGHEKVMTTFLSYGQVEGHRQGEIIRGLGAEKTAPVSATEDIAEALFRKMRAAGMGPVS